MSVAILHKHVAILHVSVAILHVSVAILHKCVAILHEGMVIFIDWVVCDIFIPSKSIQSICVIGFGRCKEIMVRLMLRCCQRGYLTPLGCWSKVW